MHGLGLPPAVRLRRAVDFAALRRARGQARNRYFRLRYGANAGVSARLGMAVSRRVATRAVERNRIKRLVRESFRHRRAQLPCVDILIIAQREAAYQPARVLREELAQLWPRVRPLNGADAAVTMTG
jgi:ribonuclease P protein component